jgi:lipopolysaccharide transport system ATP-binding protein
MRDTVIRIEGLSKRYLIQHQGNRHDGLRHVIERMARSPLRWMGTKRREWREKTEELWALRDVSCEVKQGDAVGIIGRNGAGKSTLLKILSRITEPTGGRIRITGRVASLLEVGTGFHPDLTGRENIFLNGAILGMQSAEIRRKFDEIVAFSEIERFLDTPVKRYSSGMYVRLAFAVAAHLEPDILVVDEVLAVGDAAFQKKCLGKMGEVAGSGRTVLFVSHSMEAVRRLCRRAILLEAGTIASDGSAEEVVDAYWHAVSSVPTCYENRDHGLVVTRVALKDSEGRETHDFSPGDDLIIEVYFEARRRIERPYFLLIVSGIHGKCFTASMLLDGHRPVALHGVGHVACRFKSLPLLPQQRYGVSMSIRASNGQDVILDCPDIESFAVLGDLGNYGYTGDYHTHASRSTSVVVPYEWHFPDGVIAQVALTRLSTPRRLADF